MEKFAYITLLFPNKTGECTYLDGALLLAFGLRKQNTKYKLICMVTPDTSQDTINILQSIYDEIVVVDYITPVNNKGITIIKDIFSKNDYFNDYQYREICHVFTKLHIFDSNKFSYDKLVFIDNDIIPIKNYDELFDLETPAGWVEQILELNQDFGKYYTRIWGQWNNIGHGSLIPDFITNIYEEPGSCVNAGLLVIKPDKKLFDFFIKQLQTPKHKWFGKNHIHKGCIDILRRFVNYYPFPEQCYLTQHFSGQWHMIDGLYATWGLKDNSYGMHMAGLKYMINGQMKEHKSWQVQMLKVDGFNDITNQIALWGLERYPESKKYLMKNLKIIIDNSLIKFLDINRNILNDNQQRLYDILKN